MNTSVNGSGAGNTGPGMQESLRRFESVRWSYSTGTAASIGFRCEPCAFVMYERDWYLDEDGNLIYG